MSQDNPVAVRPFPITVDPDPDVTAQQRREQAAGDRPATLGASVVFYPAPRDGVGPWAALVTAVHQAGWVDLIVFEPGKAPIPVRAVGLRIKDDVVGKWDWPDVTDPVFPEIAVPVVVADSP